MPASKEHSRITNTSCDSKLTMDTAVAVEVCFQANYLPSDWYINDAAGGIRGTKSRRCKVTERDL